MAATSGISNYLEKKVLLWLSGTTFVAAPTNIFLALFAVSPTDGGATVAGTETDYASYARTSVAAATIFAVAPAGIPSAVTSQSTVTCPTATGNSSAAVVAWGFFDAASAGNLLCYGPVGTPQSVANGQTPTFNAASLTVKVQ